jgi:hypothetical protein
MGTGHFYRFDTYLAVPYQNMLTFPAFQFDQGRDLWPGFVDVLMVLRDAGGDQFAITVWFVSHHGAANGDIPALVIRDDPDGAIAAARRSIVGW